METVKVPRVKIEYEGKDITQDIQKYLLSVQYTDNEANESDEISFTLEDKHGLWKSEWFPTKGDRVRLAIGYDDELLECGKFTVDEIEMSGPPDIVVLRALAAGVTSPLRTKNSKAFEGQTLRQIAQAVADKYGYKIVATDGSTSILDNIRIERVTQNRETDLAFLQRVGDDYGIVFSVRDTNLIFASIYDIEKGQPVLELDRTDLIRYSVKDKATKVYKNARVRHKNVAKNENVTVFFEEKKNDGASSEDTLEIHSRVENMQQAEAKAKAKLHKANRKGQEANFSIPGKPVMVAGNNFTLTGMGALSGKYHVKKSVHNISSSGYTTDIEALRIAGPAGEKIGSRLTIGDVLFDNDQSVIKPEGYMELQKVVEYMRVNASVIIEVAGHTDSNASAEYNIGLSNRRSKACMDYLIASGISPTRLRAKGYGESRPVATNSTDAGRAKNRRTEFVVIGNIE